MQHETYVPRNKTKNLNEVVAKRNSRLERFFNHLELPVRIIGNKNNPAIIYNNMVSLSMFVHNFELNFTDKPHRGNVIKTVKLTQHIAEKREEILNLLKLYPHQAVYNIRLANTDLFLAGYNFKNSNTCEGKYPVFAKFNYKIYFKRSHTLEIMKELQQDGYILDIHKPFINNAENIIALEDEY